MIAPMTAPEEPTTPPARPGSAQDLSRRMDRMEENHANLAREVGTLAGTVARVELNQKHAEELNKLRFDALDTAIKAIDGTLERFMGRINAIVTGEVKLPQAAQGERMVAEYLEWRKGVDTRLDNQDVLNGQVKLLGRLALLLVPSNLIAVAAAIYASLT